MSRVYAEKFIKLNQKDILLLGKFLKSLKRSGLWRIQKLVIEKIKESEKESNPDEAFNFLDELRKL